MKEEVANKEQYDLLSIEGFDDDFIYFSIREGLDIRNINCREYDIAKAKFKIRLCDLNKIIGLNNVWLKSIINATKEENDE